MYVPKRLNILERQFSGSKVVGVKSSNTLTITFITENDATFRFEIKPDMVKEWLSIFDTYRDNYYYSDFCISRATSINIERLSDDKTLHIQLWNGGMMYGFSGINKVLIEDLVVIV